VVSLPGSGEVAVGDEDPVDEPPSALTRPPLSSKGQQPVWVVDGRPRYHVASCTFIAGQEAEAIPLEQAVEDGFSPCSLCDPDTALARS
jgi:hypothetical protein